jgi:peroxiredoxin
MTSTIVDQVQELHATMSATAPAEIMGAFQTEQALLEAAGAPDGAATAGTAMPDGQLLDIAGLPTSITATRAGKTAVIVFYRGAWCPYCNIALRTYQQQLVAELDSRGAVLIAISPQKPDGSLTMQQSHELTFAVLSDPGNQVAGQLGILTAPTEDAMRSQAALGLDLTEVNADGTHTLPMPTVVIVDDGGTIRWIDVRPNYGTRAEAAEILGAYDAILG